MNRGDEETKSLIITDLSSAPSDVKSIATYGKGDLGKALDGMVEAWTKDEEQYNARLASGQLKDEEFVNPGHGEIPLLIEPIEGGLKASTVGGLKPGIRNFAVRGETPEICVARARHEYCHELMAARYVTDWDKAKTISRHTEFVPWNRDA